MQYGYGRVSTTGQKDGNSLEEQKTALLAAGADVIIEECFTGTKVDRPKFTELVNKLQKGDTLIVTKLDRFARNTAEGSQLVVELVDRGVTVNILNMGIANNTPMGKLMITIMLAFAQYERDMIVERTQGGKAIAKAKEGFKEGRPAFTGSINRLEGETVLDVCKRLNISKSTYYKYAVQ